MSIYAGKKSNSFGGPNYNAPQLAKIKSRDDKNRNGAAMVWLIGSNTDENDPNNWISVKMGSPYTGTSPRSGVDSNSTSTDSGSQSSYGMFTGAPAVDNTVLLNFANGQPDRGYIVSCIQPDRMNNGMFGSGHGIKGGGPGAAKEGNPYDQNLDPEARPQRAPQDENNDSGAVKAIKKSGEDGENPNAQQDNPASVDSSPARNTSPDVMGMSSPGGSFFVIDDSAGLVRIAMASGAQILVSASTGILMMNASGNGWVRLGNGGEVDLFSSGGVNIFGGGDVNIKAGGNINMEAGGDVNSKAGGSNNVEGGGSINLKAPAWAVNSAPINADVRTSLQAAEALVLGSFSPVGDTAASAGSPSRTPAAGGGST